MYTKKKKKSQSSKLSSIFPFIFSPVVLSEVIQAFSIPDNAARMEEARESACNDMGKMLQLVLPVATQIQQEVIKSYGFNNEGEGKHNTPVSNSFTLRLGKIFLHSVFMKRLCVLLSHQDCV